MLIGSPPFYGSKRTTSRGYPPAMAPMIEEGFAARLDGVGEGSVRGVMGDVFVAREDEGRRAGDVVADGSAEHGVEGFEGGEGGVEGGGGAGDVEGGLVCVETGEAAEVEREFDADGGMGIVGGRRMCPTGPLLIAVGGWASGFCGELGESRVLRCARNDRKKGKDKGKGNRNGNCKGKGNGNGNGNCNCKGKGNCKGKSKGNRNCNDNCKGTKQRRCNGKATSKFLPVW